MPLFGRQDQHRERSPDEREYARRVREARRAGLPEPERPASLREPDPETEPVGEAEPEVGTVDVIGSEEPGGQDGHAEPPAAPPPIDPVTHALDPASSSTPEAEEPAPDVGLGAPAPLPSEPAPLPPSTEPEPLPPEPEPEPPSRDPEPPPSAPVESEAAEPEPEPPAADPLPPAADRLPPEPAAPAAAPLAWDEPAEPAEPASTGRGLPAPPWRSRSRTDDDEKPGTPAGLARILRRDRDRDRDQSPAAPRPGARLLAARPPRRARAPIAGRAAGAAPRRRTGIRITAVVALVLVAVILYGLYATFQPFQGDGHGSVNVRIPVGANADQIGSLLSAKGVVDSGFFFSLRALVEGRRGDFKAGAYTLKRDMSYAAAISALTGTAPAAQVVRVTIPEGPSRREVAALVRRDGIKGDYLAASRRSRLFDPRRYGGHTSNLEGFLFPSTYELAPRAATAERLVGDQLRAFRTKFATLDLGYARRKHLTGYDVVTIASMVEREAAIARDRPLIAAVIYNRLHDHMPLGIDATIRYGLDNYTRPLTVSELKNPTPYNTRVHLGLPPTPIGNPGLASLNAAAHPAKVPYLYFVVRPGTCGHVFETSYAQFLRDSAQYSAARARKGGRSPTSC